MQVAHTRPDPIGLIGTGHQNAIFTAPVVELHKAGHVGPNPPSRFERSVITSFPSMDAAIAEGKIRTAGELPAAAVVEVEQGVWNLMKVDQVPKGRTPGYGSNPYQFEDVFGSRSFAGPKITDPAVKALVDGDAVIKF